MPACVEQLRQRPCNETKGPSQLARALPRSLSGTQTRKSRAMFSATRSRIGPASAMHLTTSGSMDVRG